MSSGEKIDDRRPVIDGHSLPAVLIMVAPHRDCRLSSSASMLLLLFLLLLLLMMLMCIGRHAVHVVLHG